MEIVTATKSTVTLFKGANSATKRCFSQQSPPLLAMHFHQQRRRACMLHSAKSAPAEVTHCCHCWSMHHPLLCSHPLFCPCKCSGSVDECQWMPFFLCEGIQWPTFSFSSCTLPCETQWICSTSSFFPLLLSKGCCLRAKIMFCQLCSIPWSKVTPEHKTSWIYLQHQCSLFLSLTNCVESRN